MNQAEEKARDAGEGKKTGRETGEKTLEINEVKASGSNDFNKARKGALNILVSENNEVLKQGLKRFDALYNPTYAFDVDLLQKAEINKKKMLVKASDLVRVRGMNRARLLSKMIFFVRLCLKYEVEVWLADGAADEFEEKNENELVSIGMALGMSHQEARKAVCCTEKKTE